MSFPIKTLPRLILTAVGAFLATAFFAPPLILISLFTASGVPTHRIMRLWSWPVSKSMGLTFSIKGTEKIVPGTSYIITPNHQSNADILALLMTLPVRFRWVVKKELLRIPLFGSAIRGTGAISLDRKDREGSVRRLREGTSKLGGGWSVLIYPEGTRSADGRLQPLKKGAFMMAVQTGIPILPVTCNGAFKVMPKKTLTIRPGHITVTIGDPIETAGLTEEDVPAIMEKTRNELLRHLDLDYDPFLPQRGPGN